MVIDFGEKGKGREREKKHRCEREHLSVASRMLPDWESNPPPLGEQDDALTN